MTEDFIKWIHNNIGLSPETQAKVFLLLFISLILWILYF